MTRTERAMTDELADAKDEIERLIDKLNEAEDAYLALSKECGVYAERARAAESVPGTERWTEAVRLAEHLSIHLFHARIHDASPRGREARDRSELPQPGDFVCEVSCLRAPSGDRVGVLVERGDFGDWMVEELLTGRVLNWTNARFVTLIPNYRTPPEEQAP